MTPKTASLDGFISEMKKISAKSDEPNLNTFERHPKKVLGGAAAGVLAAVGGAKGLKHLKKVLKHKPVKSKDALVFVGHKFRRRGSKSHSGAPFTKAVAKSRKKVKALPAPKRFTPSEEVVVNPKGPNGSMDNLLNQVERQLLGPNADSMTGKVKTRSISVNKDTKTYGANSAPLKHKIKLTKRKK